MLKKIIWSEFSRKKEQFVSYKNQFETKRSSYFQYWQKFRQSPRQQIIKKLSQSPPAGAIPSRELEEKGQLLLPFPTKFQNHQQARNWAKKILQNRTTFAVDGSQLLPDKELLIPTALIKIGWFCNPHQKNTPFTKEIKAEIIDPIELLQNNNSDKLYSEQKIHLRRYQMEIEKLSELCTTYAQTTPKAVGFLDGSLVVSFAEELTEEYKDSYLYNAIKLLQISRQTSVPIVGYIDRSLSRDLIRMLTVYFSPENPPEPKDLRDIELLSSELQNWGDRTAAFILDRPGELYSHYCAAGGKIAFVYLRTAKYSYPVRLEFPSWLLEEKILDEVINVVLAESIVGSGYPYPLETADKLAWISSEQRRDFRNLLSQFLASLELPLENYQKQLSKERRRYPKLHLPK